MYGRSLSLCVRDILSGEVKLEEVEIIYTSTKAPTLPAFYGVVKYYREHDWQEFYYKEVDNVISYLLDNGKIVQPRVDDENLAYIWIGDGKGHWVEKLEDVFSGYIFEH